MTGFALGSNFGPAFRSRAGGVSPPATSQGIAANRATLPARVATGFLNITDKSEHWASPEGDISQLRIIWAGMYYVLGVNALTNAPSDYTIEASVEYPAGSFTRITFSGSNNGVVPAGGTLTSDEVAITIPAGTRFWVRMKCLSIVSGTSIPVWIQLPGLPSTIGTTDGGSSTSGVMSGTINPSTSGNVNGPFAIMGTIAQANAKGWMILGNSVAFGVGDTASVGVKGGSGMFKRALDPLYPYMSINLAGSKVADIDSSANIAKLDILVAALNAYGGPSHVVSEWGINDLAGGKTSAQTKASIKNILDRFSSPNKYQATLGPRALSATNNWTVTPGDQVPRTDGNWSQMPSFNTDVRALIAGTTGYIEAGDVMHNTRDDSYWKANTPQWTDDGTHPSSAGAAAIAAGLTLP